jgi:nucleoside-diphosphate-sugar epimerase
VRPTLVYSDEGGAEFRHFVKHIKKWPVLFMIGNGQAKKSPVHTDDLVQGLAAIHANSKAYGKTYNLSGGESISLYKMLQIILFRIRKKKNVIFVPFEICRVLSIVLQWISRPIKRHSLLNWQTISGVIQNADLDCSEAVKDLGFLPRSFENGIRSLKSL